MRPKLCVVGNCNGSESVGTRPSMASKLDDDAATRASTADITSSRISELERAIMEHQLDEDGGQPSRRVCGAAVDLCLLYNACAKDAIVDYTASKGAVKSSKGRISGRPKTIAGRPGGSIDPADGQDDEVSEEPAVAYLTRATTMLESKTLFPSSQMRRRLLAVSYNNLALFHTRRSGRTHTALVYLDAATALELDIVRYADAKAR